MEDRIFFCERCCQWSHKNNTFIETTKLTKYNYNASYHIECLPENEKCSICKLFLKDEESIDIFVDYNFQSNLYHKSCINNEENIFTYDICNYCYISLRAKCESCNHRFNDCYNPSCKNYGPINDGRYDGQCEKCNW